MTFNDIKPFHKIKKTHRKSRNKEFFEMQKNLYMIKLNNMKTQSKNIFGKNWDYLQVFL